MPHSGNLLVRLKNRYVSAYDAMSRDIVHSWSTEYLSQKCEPRVLDIGCGQGDDLIRIINDVPAASAYGLDILPENIANMRQRNIEVRVCNLENQEFPFEQGYFDLVIANQVLEHLKNWVWVLMQIGTVLKKSGRAIIGVPNLASWHNRILLLLGRQPSCINTAGMHIRGFTYPGLKEVVEYKGVYRVVEMQGCPFYPFSPGVSRGLSKVFPRGSACLFIMCEKTGDPSDYGTLEAISRQKELSL
jgi:methionine biosynthesis protein MetW